MSKEVARPRGTNISRHGLRKFLAENGACTVEQLVAVASLTADGVTVERLNAELAEHPGLFREEPDGRWSAAPEQPRVFVRRTGGFPPPKRKNPAPRRPRRQRREPPAEPFSLEAGRLSWVTVPLRATEIGGDMVATVEVPAERLDEIVGAASESIATGSAIEVFQGAGVPDALFRGTRPLVSVRATSEGHVRFVLGPALDDDAAVRALPSAQARELQSTAPGEVVPYRPDLPILAVLPPAPPSLLAAADVPPARRPAAPEVTGGLSDVLEAIRIGDAGVAELDAWLADNLASLDAEQRQRQGVRIARAKGLTEADRLSRARELIDPETLPTKLCGPLLLELGSSLEETSDLANWASPMLDRAVTDQTNDPRLLQRCARIAFQASRFDLAVDLGRRAVAAGCVPTADDVDLLAEAAVDTGDSELVESLWDVAVEQLADTKPTKMPGTWLSALVSVEKYLSDLGSPDAERRGMIVELHIARQQPDLALDIVEDTVFDDRFRFTDRLASVSVLEQFDRKADLRKAAELLHRLIIVETGTVTDQLIGQAVDQLRYLEQLGGFTGDYSDTFVVAGPEPGVVPVSDATAAGDTGDLSGTTIVIVGGQRAGRQRIKERFESLGAKIKQIPPSWDGRLDSGQIRRTCDGAQLVVEMTREMKHDASYILDTIPGINERRMRVWGGPSAVIREVLHWSAHAAA